MTHRYRIDPFFGLLIDKFEGKMDWHDVWEAMLNCTKDPEFQTGLNVLADLTAVDLKLDYGGARDLVLSTSEVSTMKYGRIAVVAPEKLQFGLARMFGTLAENYEIYTEYRVFTDLTEVRTWLGLPEDLELSL